MADVLVSNVDKKSAAGELAVLLCNYTDVYYQTKITADLGFMSATATPSQIARFGLRAGDSIITKDSETAVDIAVPAYVPRDLPGVVCGYHLALVRPRHAAIDSSFLGWVLQSDFIRDQFASRASGVTRYGLTYEAIQGAQVPFSNTLEEQRRIADFLDEQVTRIDAAVSAVDRRRLSLAARVQSSLESLLTGGETGSQVPSWAPFGSLPRSWIECRLRSIPCQVQTGPFGSQLHSEEYVASGWPVVNPANLVESRIVPTEGVSVDDATRERLRRHVLVAGDVVFGRRGELGRAGLVQADQVGWVCGTGSLRVRLRSDLLEPGFLVRLLRTEAIRYFFDQQAVGSTMANLNTGILMAMPLLVPPIGVQRSLLWDAQRLELEHSEAIRLCLAQSALLQERKRVLITAAVTGELDVSTAGPRAAAAVTS